MTEASATLAESSGGLAFEVKLTESPRHGAAIHPPLHFLSPSSKVNQNDLATPLTPESITEKLKRAEERRLSLEQLRSTLLAAENSRPVEVSKIRDQQAEGTRRMTFVRIEDIVDLCRIQETNGRKAAEETGSSEGKPRTGSASQSGKGQSADRERFGYGSPKSR